MLKFHHHLRSICKSEKKSRTLVDIIRLGFCNTQFTSHKIASVRYAHQMKSENVNLLTISLNYCIDLGARCTPRWLHSMPSIKCFRCHALSNAQKADTPQMKSTELFRTDSSMYTFLSVCHSHFLFAALHSCHAKVKRDPTIKCALSHYGNFQM